ncbi:MAG: four helix bundle protein [Gemmatimonadales bacterium]
MAGVHSFEDLRVWQEARTLTREIYAVTGGAGLARDYGLVSQLRRSAVSVMANIAEGFSRGRPREFSQYLSIARASCAELRSHLYVALDTHQLRQEDFFRLLRAALGISRMLTALKLAVTRKGV